MNGPRTLPPDRRLGPAGHDPITAPDSLGLVPEFQYVRTRTAKLIKMPCPGPFTLAGRIAPGTAYKDRVDVAHVLAEIINA